MRERSPNSSISKRFRIHSFHLYLSLSLPSAEMSSAQFIVGSTSSKPDLKEENLKLRETFQMQRKMIDRIKKHNLALEEEKQVLHREIFFLLKKSDIEKKLDIEEADKVLKLGKRRNDEEQKVDTVGKRLENLQLENLKSAVKARLQLLADALEDLKKVKNENRCSDPLSQQLEEKLEKQVEVNINEYMELVKQLEDHAEKKRRIESSAEELQGDFNGTYSTNDDYDHSESDSESDDEYVLTESDKKVLAHLRLPSTRKEGGRDVDDLSKLLNIPREKMMKITRTLQSEGLICPSIYRLNFIAVPTYELEGYDNTVVGYLEQPSIDEHEKGAKVDDLSKELNIPMEDLMELVVDKVKQGVLYYTDEQHVKVNESI